jgi:hypothetical protein
MISNRDYKSKGWARKRSYHVPNGSHPTVIPVPIQSR